MAFYYGSSKNVFWRWYSLFVDNSVQPTDLRAIEYSLKSKQIGITNIITSTKRRGKSSFDYDLYDRVYNLQFFQYPKVKDRLRILCTSKTVLNEMLLSKGFFDKHSSIRRNHERTLLLRNQITSGIEVIEENINQPICQSLDVKGAGLIECVSIPSPGSPFRGLQFFGKPKQMNSKTFLRDYLTNAFSWFNGS